ncbi:MAG: hypothetical protein MUE55_00055 [Thermoplasmata archaeon]|nr:hypothetical protein [Thermoplasmata archaeon]
MYGDRAPDDRAQLALMDAMVFFAIALVTSSIVLSYTDDRPSDLMGAVDGAVDPGDVLRVFLRASVGTDIELWDGLTVSARESVADCLYAEVAYLTGGANPGSFAGMNEVLLDVLENISPVGTTCHLSVVDAAGSGEPLLTIERAPAIGGVLLSASQEFPAVMGSECLAVLVLAPALCLE